MNLSFGAVNRLVVVISALFMFLNSVALAAIDDSIPQNGRWKLFTSFPDYGLIIPHSKQMTHLIQGHTMGMHITALQTLNRKPWHSNYNYPEHGGEIGFLTTGNVRQLGHQLTASYYLNLPLNRKKIDSLRKFSKWRLHHWLGLGLGIGYSTRIWNLADNHQAPVIGSHFNAALTLQYSTRIYGGKMGELRGGLRVVHLSNGAFQIPNLGTNNAGIFLSYSPCRLLSPITSDIAPMTKPSKRYQLSIFSGAGLKEIQPPTRKKFAALTFSLLGEHRPTYKSAYGVGFDIFYNSANRAQQEHIQSKTYNAGTTLQLGVIASYSLYFDRFELKMQQGMYILDQYRLNGMFYNRFGLRYALQDHWFVQLTLKTHFAKADYGEIGVGYRF